MGRGAGARWPPLLVTKARGQALGTSDLVVVVGTPLDFRLGYGVFGGKDGSRRRRVVHLADSAGQVSGHAELAASASGDLTAVLDALLAAVDRLGSDPTGTPGSATSRRRSRPRSSATRRCSAPRRTRSTRRASTASWCPGWPTTRS